MKPSPSSGTVRLSPKAIVWLNDLAAKTGETKASLLEKAVSRLHEELFWDQVDAAFAAEGDYREEAKSLEGSLLDGLEE